MKIKSSQNGAKGVRIGFSKVGAVVLVVVMLCASAGGSVATGPAADRAGSSFEGSALKGPGRLNATLEIQTNTEASIYVASGSEVHKLSNSHGGSVWSHLDQASEAIEVAPDGDVFAANASAVVSWDSSGSLNWANRQYDYSITEVGYLEYYRNNVTLWDHNDGFENKVYSIHEENGTVHTKISSGIQEPTQIEGWDDYYWGSAQDGFDESVRWVRWDAPLHGSNSNVETYLSYLHQGTAIGSSEDYVWMQRWGNDTNGSEFWAYNVDANKELSINISENEDQIDGYGQVMYGVNNGSVRRYKIEPDGDWTLDWETNIWGSNESMQVKVNPGKGNVVVANDYDVALLDKDGNLQWTRTFSAPVDDIGISESQPETYKISGEVFDANNNPIENATIEVQTSFQTIAGAQTNASGYYEVTGIEAGTYTIVAWKSGYDTVKKQRDISGDIVLDFLLQKADENTLEGNVDDAYGNPIANATVEVVSNGQTISSNKTDSNGFYSVPGIPNGTYEVVASKQGYQSTSVTLTINSYTTQDFILVKGENIVRGYVRDTDGDVIEDVIVAFGQNNSAVTSTTTDKDGYYEVLIDDGNYTVIFSKNGFEEVKLNRSIFSDQWLNATMGNLTLIIEAPRYMKHGTEATYKVWVSNGSDRWEVTTHPNLTLTSSNYSVLGIDRANQKLEATPDASINKLIVIRANYEYTNQTELYDDHEVTVANATVSQLPILPPWWRFNAVMNDDTIFALIIMIWTAVVGNRLTTSFGGLAAGAIAGIIFWYAGYLSVGMMLLAGFVALFLGMNVATNIEYSVRQ